MLARRRWRTWPSSICPVFLLWGRISMAPEKRSLSREPTSRNSGVTCQHVFSWQLPEVPWHLHFLRMFSITTCQGHKQTRVNHTRLLTFCITYYSNVAGRGLAFRTGCVCLFLLMNQLALRPSLPKQLTLLVQYTLHSFTQLKNVVTKDVLFSDVLISWGKWAPERNSIFSRQYSRYLVCTSNFGFRTWIKGL